MGAALRSAGAVIVAGALASAAPARADDEAGQAVRSPRRADLPARLADADTAYGRLDGDLGLVVGLGVAVGGAAPRGAGELRLRYLETAGVYVSYEDSFGAATDPARTVSAGLELRPLFLGRWATGRELGLSWLDLLIDSVGLELGACFEQPPVGGFDGRPGLEAGLGLEVPIVPRASGLWLDIHGGARWADEVLGAGQLRGASSGAAFLTVTLAFHQRLATHVVDVNDRAP